MAKKKKNKSRDSYILLIWIFFLLKKNEFLEISGSRDTFPGIRREMIKKKRKEKIEGVISARIRARGNKKSW